MRTGIDMALARASGLLLAQSCLILVGVGCNPATTGSSPALFSDAIGGANSGNGGTSSNALGRTGGASAAGVSGGNGPNGGSAATGGTGATGGASAVGGTKGPTGGASTTGTSKTTGGTSSAGGVSTTGTSKTTGGTSSAGGTLATGGSKTTGGTKGATGGVSTTGATKPTGGSTANGGLSATGGASSTSDCAISVTPGISSGMATVGTVDWSTSASVSSAQIVYTLNNAGPSILNKGGTAPVDLTKSKYHTLLLGLKQSSTYTAHVEATLSDGSTCKSDDFAVTTKSLTGAPSVTRTATNATAQANGFIVTSNGGISGSGPAFIIDADGAVVWSSSSGPASCSRARMDYEGANMWMMNLNVSNQGGEMRYVSMDGVTSQNNVSGLSKAHHDFTVLKNSIVATMIWSSTGTDPESDLVERSADGTVKTVFHIGSNLYAGGPSALGGSSNSYHCNSISYHSSDDSYTIGDRNPSSYVKASRSGTLAWQFGGSCSGAKASKCASGSWQINHGHQLLDNGNFLLFNNGSFGSTAASHAFEYKLSTSGTMSATLVKDYVSSNNYHSDSLGDVQRLPNGNTLITYSNKGVILELDSAWNVVQSLSVGGGSIGYADWRETLYGAPARQ